MDIGTLTKAQVEAWKRLKKILAKVPRKRFRMEQWVGQDWKGAKDLSCGTVACAAGWATSDPWFRRRGLRLKQSDAGLGYLADPSALERLFGDQATSLFFLTPLSLDDYRVRERLTPKHFIKEIDLVLKLATKP